MTVSRSDISDDNSICRKDPNISTREKNFIICNIRIIDCQIVTEK